MENDTATGAPVVDRVPENPFEGMSKHFSDAAKANDKPDVKVESSPTKQEATHQAPSSKDVKPAEGELPEVDWSKLPAHMHPTVKGIMEERKKDREKLRALEAQLKDPKMARMLAKGEAPQAAPQQTTTKNEAPSVPDEQKQALDQLRQLLGLDSIAQEMQKLQARNAELTERETDAAFDKEETELKAKASEFGLDWESEVMPQVAEWFEKNPQFRGLGPGSIKIAFNSTFFDRMGELQERAANLKLIKQQETLKKVGTESPQKVSAKGAPKEESIGQFFKRRAAEMGD